MNSCFDYMMTNFGGAHLLGFHIICDLVDNYDITNVHNSYILYGKNHNMSAANVERAVRHYIHVIGTTKQIENTLKCKCLNGKNFSNKEFLMAIRERVARCKSAKK